VYHGGNVGPDGEALVETLRNAGVDTRLIRRVEEVTGHAVIQVDSRGDNSIILYAGANARVTTGQIDQVLEEFAPGDYLILQNEINRVGEIIEKAFDKGMLIVLNPSPMNEEIRKLPLEKVSFFLLNEIEGEELTGKREPGEILDELLIRYPHARIVLTLGGKGSVYADREKRIHQDIYKVEAVDTTAAGDTFTGYFISTLIRTGSCREALDMAARASAIAVSRQGAAPSIPALDEVCGAGV
ncbi:MAG: ribokinase, partial [Acetatifactor sp.]|nr:ribokinase [Acetatifactor sp.]